MRNSLICGALAAGLAAVSAPALAQDVESIHVVSQVARFCQALDVTAAPDMALQPLSDANGFVVGDFSGDVELTLAGNYYCNSPALVTLKARPLQHATETTVADAASFTNRIDYTARVDWGAWNDDVSSTVSAPTPVRVDTANAGELKISISAPQTDGDRRPIQGDYVGAVELTIAATI